MAASVHNLKVHTVTTRDKGNGLTEAFVQLRYDLSCSKGDDPMLLSLHEADAFVKKTTLVLKDRAETRKLEEQRDVALTKYNELKDTFAESTKRVSKNNEELEEQRDGALAKCKELQDKVDELTPSIAVVVSEDQIGKENADIVLAIPFLEATPHGERKKYCCIIV